MIKCTIRAKGLLTTIAEVLSQIIIIHLKFPLMVATMLALLCRKLQPPLIDSTSQTISEKQLKPMFLILWAPIVKHRHDINICWNNVHFQIPHKAVLR